MGLRVADRSTPLRADTLTTKREVFGVWISHNSPRIIVVFLASVTSARALIGGFGWVDIFVLLVTTALVGPVEWTIHRVLLHAPDDSIRARKLRTTDGHHQHHLDPSDVGWIMLSPKDAATYCVALGFWSLWTVPVMWLTSDVSVGPWLTGVVAAQVSLAHYEWVHLLNHSRYRPRSRFYKRLSTTHAWHHYRNEHYWLGITSLSGDRVLGTLRSHANEVPRSATARSLAE